MKQATCGAGKSAGYMFFIVTALMLLLSAVAQSADDVPAPASPPPSADQIVHILDYLSVDYGGAVKDGKIIDASEYKEQSEFAGNAVDAISKLPPNPAREGALAGARKLLAVIAAQGSSDEVSQLSRDVRTQLIAAYGIVVAPSAAPDLKAGATLFEAQCSACHGAQGRGDGPAGKSLDPQPANFHNLDRMQNRSLYSLFSTISLGVSGTAMTGFKSLSEQQRWALAFYVASLRNENAGDSGEKLWRKGTAHAQFETLKDLASVTEKEIATAHGADTVAVYQWLIAHPAQLTAQTSPLAFSKRVLGDMLQTYRSGDKETAQKLAVTAYLEGFELVEVTLDTLDQPLRLQTERQMMALREMIRNNATPETVEQQVNTLYGLLDEAQACVGGGELSVATTAFSAFLILAREGLEALLVVATIVAFLRKAGRQDALRYIHIGWISALVLGFATWFAASYLISISGASRELTEGTAALFAVVILIYVGFWLHSKAYAQRWKLFIEQHLQGALSKGTLWALASVSFIAVYREAFETVLFYEALWTQSGPAGAAAMIGGLACGALTLVAVSWAIFRYGLRMPIGPFFAISSILLALLAVAFSGQGIKALQEAGKINSTAFDHVPTLSMLGIFPTEQTVLAQLITLAVVIIGFGYGYLSSRKPSAA